MYLALTVTNCSHTVFTAVTHTFLIITCHTFFFILKLSEVKSTVLKMLKRFAFSYISFSFCLCFCKGMSVKDLLEEDLRKTDQEKFEVSIEIRILVHELEAQNEECDKRLRALELTTNAGHPEYQHLVRVMSSLWADINLMQSRKEQIIETVKNIEKLQLGVYVSEIDIHQQEERRRNGLTSKCLFLEGMAPVVHEPRYSLSGNEASSEEAMIVLQNQLQAAQSKLSNLLFEKMEKNTRKKVNEALCGLKLQRLNEAVQKLNEYNNSEAGVAVDLLALELEMVTGEVKELARSASISLKNLNRDILKSEAKKQMRVHKQFVSEKLCFAKLTEHLRYDENIWKLWNESWFNELINNNP